MGTQDWLWEERQARAQGYRCLAGIDEVGRGALAGPVVAACVVLPYDQAPEGVNDSKALTPDQRARCFDNIVRLARGIGIGMVDAPEIDVMNILQATHKAMRLALQNLHPALRPDLVFIDGLPVHPFPLSQRALIKGDQRCASIAAASIIAKVTRDRLMIAHAERFPEYGFAAHKGYGAPAHLRALTQQGPCPLHRRTFRPVAESLPGRERTSSR